MPCNNNDNDYNNATSGSNHNRNLASITISAVISQSMYWKWQVGSDVKCQGIGNQIQSGDITVGRWTSWSEQSTTEPM
jgi:hypothetical protein